MARTINQVQLTGRLGADPTFLITETDSKTHIAKFSIATQRYMGPGREPATDWHNVVCFGKVADAVYANKHKGDQVQVSGHLHQSQWGSEGEYRSRTEVYANSVTFLRNKMPAMAPAHAEAAAEMPEAELVAAD